MGKIWFLCDWKWYTDWSLGYILFSRRDQNGVQATCRGSSLEFLSFWGGWNPFLSWGDLAFQVVWESQVFVMVGLGPKGSLFCPSSNPGYWLDHYIYIQLPLNPNAIWRWNDCLCIFSNLADCSGTSFQADFPYFDVVNISGRFDRSLDRTPHTVCTLTETVRGTW